MIIDESLVKKLISTQFPEWKDLPIQKVASSGWDNKTFHLGGNMTVRLPSAAEYELQVEKEHRWLPKLGPFFSLAIPEPIAMGEPGDGYPWKWSIYRWIEGDSAASTKIADQCRFANDLAQFLAALQKIDAAEGPTPGLHSFHRGGALKVYDDETRRSLEGLKGKIDTKTATEMWEEAIAIDWVRAPVWVHGDISAGNLLVKDGKLHAVIDFGQLAIGDPACDMQIAWTMFEGKSRQIFQKSLQLDIETWNRGRAWTLWKALVVAAGFTNPTNTESADCWRIIDEVLSDYNQQKR